IRWWPNSLDLFRCESALLRTHWVLVVMDQCTRRIVGFGVHRSVVDGVGLSCMFNRATRGLSSPKYLSSGHDPLYRFHQWQASPEVLFSYPGLRAYNLSRDFKRALVTIVPDDELAEPLTLVMNWAADWENGRSAVR